MKTWAVVMMAFAGALVMMSTASQAQQSAAMPKGGPEFAYESPAVRQLVTRVRTHMGTQVPKAIRLEGTMTWRGRTDNQRWGLTLRWPTLYQSRVSPPGGANLQGKTYVLRTLENDVYRTNIELPPDLRARAGDGLKDQFVDWSLLFFLRPPVAGMRIKVDGTATVDGASVRRLVVRNERGPWLEVYLHATEDRVVASGRPWNASSENGVQLTIVKQTRTIDGVVVPTRIEQVYEKHVSIFEVEPAVGAKATVDE